MIKFKDFVTAIHDAVMGANTLLNDKNIDLLEKYFEEEVRTEPPSEANNNKEVQKNIMVPKSVIMEYPSTNEDGSTRIDEVHVPIITMIPLQTTKIEKATFTANFELLLVNGDIQLNFTDKANPTAENTKPGNNTSGTLEITISPQESSEGLKLLIEGYENLLKKQIP